MSSAPQIAVAVAAPGSGFVSVDQPFALGQNGNFATLIAEWYASFTTIQTATMTGDAAPGNMAIATFRTT